MGIEFAANPRWLGATGAFTLVLHTWKQDLRLHLHLHLHFRLHLHVHAVMACGGLDKQGHWVAPKRSPTFLSNERILSMDAAEFLKRVAQIDATRCPHCALGRWRTL